MITTNAWRRQGRYFVVWITAAFATWVALVPAATSAATFIFESKNRKPLQCEPVIRLATAVSDRKRSPSFSKALPLTFSSRVPEAQQDFSN